MEQRLQNIERLLHRDLFRSRRAKHIAAICVPVPDMGQWNIAGFIILQSEANAHQFGFSGIQTVGFQIYGNDIFRHGPVDPALQKSLVLDTDIFFAVKFYIRGRGLLSRR